MSEQPRVPAGHPEGGQWVASGTVADLQPSLTVGEPNRCFENARQEFLAQKASGKKPIYVVGSLVSYRRDDDEWTRREKKVVPEHHAWVVVDGKPIDPTPFKYGRGDYVYLPKHSAKEHWADDGRYEPDYTIHESKLQHPLSDFPSAHIEWQLGNALSRKMFER